MQTVKIGKHTVEYFDAIDALPITRFHRYQKAMLIDAGIGADIQSFDQRIERMRRFLMSGKNDKAQIELENMRQCVHFIQQGIAPKHLAFAALVYKIDGQICEDLSDDGLQKIVAMLSDGTTKELTEQLDSVKKKIDNELTLYFPALFNQSDIKEYFDLLKKRTLAVLQNIIDGVEIPDGTPAIDKLTTELITYSNPKSFTGPEGTEIQYDRQFENLCLALSAQLNILPKKCSVLEFYNAFDYLQQKAKREQRDNRAKRGR